jgi:2-oxoisovalerate dehydrogenase E1 component
MPLVLRVSVGSKYGAQHSQDWTSMVAHIPGLQVMFPATAYDAKGMLNLALSGTDPVVFFESQRLYPEPETLVAGGVPTDYYEVELGEPAVRREGSDLTIITIGATLYRALEAAELLQASYGVSAEVIDVRFINPLNYGPLVESVKKTGKVVVASDACERGSFAHTIASNLSQVAFDHLDGPVAVVGARNWITPAAELEEAFFPQKEWIVDVVHERILPLPGHQVTTRQATGEIFVRNRAGV